jgi:hypothetical protein
LDYNRVLGNVRGFYTSALGGSSTEVQVPPTPSDGSRTRPGELTDVEVEQAIMPLFDYFEANLQTLNTYLSDATKQEVMAKVWKQILVTIEGLLIPPLSDIPSDMKPLSDKEVDIVFKWLKVLDYLHSDLCANRWVLVFESLFLRRWGGPGTAGDATKSEVSGGGLDSVVLRLAHVWLSQTCCYQGCC